MYQRGVWEQGICPSFYEAGERAYCEDTAEDEDGF